MASRTLDKRNLARLAFLFFIAGVAVAGFVVVNLQASSNPQSKKQSQTKLEVNAKVDNKTSQPSQTESTLQQVNSDVDVKVNGQEVPVPQSGSVHKDITNNNGNTSVDIESYSAATGDESNSSSQSSSIRIESHSYSSTSVSNSNLKLQNGEVSQ